MLYLPTMLFGGSSILHLLAGHPRVVAFFGLAAAVTMTLYAPFGPQPVPGTAQYVEALDRRLVSDEAVDPAVIEDARASARALMNASPARLRAIVDETLAACGQGCIGIDADQALKDVAVLQDVLLVHELTRVRIAVVGQRTSRTASQ